MPHGMSWIIFVGLAGSANLLPKLVSRVQPVISNITSRMQDQNHNASLDATKGQDLISMERLVLRCHAQFGKFCFLESENFYQGSAPPQINSITLLDMFLCETIPADAPAACWKLRLMVSLALQGKFAQLLMMLATVCSTWVAVNVGTSRRSVLTPSGLWHYTSVRKANKQVTRSGLRNKFCKC